jgi:heme-degrading monooxygenase HmoA
VIARLWSAIAGTDNLSGYRKHFSEEVLPALKKCDGFAAAILLTRDVGRDSDKQAEKEVLVTTYWKSMQAIEAFAGADCEAAVVAPEAAALLRTFDKRVRHYAVDVAASSESISIFAGRG